jgi:hypothetical protein
MRADVLDRRQRPTCKAGQRSLVDETQRGPRRFGIGAGGGRIIPAASRASRTSSRMTLQTLAVCPLPTRGRSRGLAVILAIELASPPVRLSADRCSLLSALPAPLRAFPATYSEPPFAATHECHRSDDELTEPGSVRRRVAAEVADLGVLTYSFTQRESWHSERLHRMRARPSSWRPPPPRIDLEPCLADQAAY